MRVIFLCGGIGKRMLPITKDKSLISFVGKELIIHQLELAERYTDEKPVIIGSPLNIGEIKKVAGGRAEYAVQAKPAGMADAVLSAKEFLKGEVLIVGANDVFEPSAYELVTKSEGDSAILGVKVEKYFPGGYLITEGDRVKGMVEKPGEGNEPSDLVNMVFHLHRDAEGLVKYLEGASSSKDDVYEVALDKMCKERDVRAVPYSGFWGAMKYPFHILKITQYFLDRQKPSVSPEATVSDKATVVNSVVEAGARIFENAVVNNAYIGRNCIVANNALVRNSNLEERSVAGYSTEVARSYVASNVWFHNNYVGDSVIMDNTMFGSGCVTANFRFDEKEVYMEIGKEKISTGSDKFGCVVGENCKTGINSSIYPGVKIGENSFLGPGVVLNKSVEANSVLFLKQNWERREQKDVIDANKKLELMKRLKK